MTFYTLTLLDITDMSRITFFFYYIQAVRAFTESKRQELIL